MEKKFTSANFETDVLTSDKPVLVDFYADWCGPCKMMAPMVKELADELSDTITVGKLNIDENMDIAMNYRVASIPTLMLFKGGKPAGKLVGVQDKDDVLDMIENA